MSRRQLIAGNWKMHGFRESVAEARGVVEAVGKGLAPHADVLICPPFTLIASVCAVAGPAKVMAKKLNKAADRASVARMGSNSVQE